MLLMMYPGGLSAGQRAAVMQQLMKNGRLGIEPGEVPGSLHDALMAVAPGMRMMPGATEPGETPQMMVDMLVASWKRKAARMPDIPPIDMRFEPSLPPIGRASAARVASR